MAILMKIIFFGKLYLYVVTPRGFFFSSVQFCRDTANILWMARFPFRHFLSSLKYPTDVHADRTFYEENFLSSETAAFVTRSLLPYTSDGADVAIEKFSWRAVSSLRTR